MRKFITNFILFFLVLIITLISVLLILQFTNIFTDVSGPDSVVHISEMKSNKKIKKIYIGDSVADQLFGHNKIDSNGCISMTLNAALTVYGHYLLLDNLCYTNNNYLDSNTEVVLIISLKGLATDLTRPTTFNYFIKPFYNTKFILKHNDSYVLDNISDYNFLSISQTSIVKFRPYLTENIENVINNKLLSDINILGLKKIQEFCKKRNLRFSIYIMPLSDYWDHDISKFKMEFQNANLNEVSIALNKFKTTPDKYFVFDHVHFKSKKEGLSFLNGSNVILQRIK